MRWEHTSKAVLQICRHFVSWHSQDVPRTGSGLGGCLRSATAIAWGGVCFCRQHMVQPLARPLCIQTALSTLT